MRIGPLTILALFVALIELMSGTSHAATRGAATPDTSLIRISEGYVKLVLALGRHDQDFVDAYYGPPAWRKAVEAEKPTLSRIDFKTAALIAELKARAVPSDEMDRLRQRYLLRQLESLAARIRMLSGSRMSFDDESRALYDAVAPPTPDSVYAGVLARLEALIPGEGPLAERYDIWRKDFVIPSDKVDTVFRVAIQEGRRRTLAHIKLPPEESFTVEYVTGKSWSGYNWYQGGYRSLIQINVDLPIHIDRAIDLACHEGYPGHHVYNMLLEQHLVNRRGWREFSVYALFSPQSLIAEGTAVYGPDLAFPREEKLAFEREVLYPLAGLDPARAERYAEVQDLMEQLKSASAEVARRYLDGHLDRESAIEWSMQNELRTRARAERGIRFAEQYRSYTINYPVGVDLVRSWIEREAVPASNENRWKVFARLLASPRLPSDLR